MNWRAPNASLLICLILQSSFLPVFQIAIANPGSLNVYVKNVNGQYVSDAKVILYDSGWNIYGQKYTNPSGYVYWSNIPDGQYHTEVYYPSPASLGYTEFWGGDNVYVSGSKSIYITRHTQWGYHVKVNGQYLPGLSIEIDPNEKIHVEVKVKNSEIVAKNVKVRLIVDRSKSSGWDYSQER